MMMMIVMIMMMYSIFLLLLANLAPLYFQIQTLAIGDPFYIQFFPPLSSYFTAHIYFPSLKWWWWWWYIPFRLIVFFLLCMRQRRIGLHNSLADSCLIAWGCRHILSVQKNRITWYSLLEIYFTWKFMSFFVFLAESSKTTTVYHSLLH